MSDVAWVFVGLLTAWLGSAYLILRTVEPHEHISPAWIDIAFLLGPLFLLFGLCVAAQVEVERAHKRLKRRIAKWREGNTP